jgi:hypothetical protein
MGLTKLQQWRRVPGGQSNAKYSTSERSGEIRSDENDEIIRDMWEGYVRAMHLDMK